MKLKHFDIKEFDSPDLLGSGKEMNELFLKMIDKAREKAGISFKVNSGYRTNANNKKVGGKPNSSHLKGLAADIAINNSHERYKIIEALLIVGFKRIGIGKNFIHCDIDKTKPEGVIWDYYENI